jgi:prolyl-tRNA editing enzyme YbaK/EbsC (Cys-tRNA(Pro) deacylase)
MHKNAELVQEALRAAGSDAAVVELPTSARTSTEAAAAIGVEVGQIAKSLVFAVDGEAVVAVLSRTDRLDPDKLRRALGGTTVERADANGVRAATGFPIGGVSPRSRPRSPSWCRRRTAWWPTCGSRPSSF